MVELQDLKGKTIKADDLALVYRERPMVGPDDKVNDDDLAMVGYLYFVSVQDLAADSKRRRLEYLKTQMTIREYKELLALMPEISQEKRKITADVLEVKCEKGTMHYVDDEQLERVSKLTSGDNEFSLYLNGTYEREVYYKTPVGNPDTYDEEKRKKLYLELTNGDALSDNPEYGIVKGIKKISGEIPYSIITLKYKNGLTRKLPSHESTFVDLVEKELEKFQINELKSSHSQPSQPQQPQEPVTGRTGVPSWLDGKRQEKEDFKIFTSPSSSEPKRPWHVPRRSESEDEEPTPMTPEEIAEAKIKKAKARKRRNIAVAIIFSGLMLSGVYILITKASGFFAKQSGGEAEPSFTPTASATFAPEPTPTAQPTASPTASPTATPVATPNYKSGEDLVAELKAKGYKYILSGDIITFDNDMATNVLRFLSNDGVNLFKGLDENLIRETILDYQQAILFYCADTLDPTTSGPVYIGDSCNISSAEKDLLRKVTDMARNIANLSVDQPLNGKIIDSDEEIANFDKDYVNAVNALLTYQDNSLENDPTYANANLRYKYVVRSIITTAIKAYAPAYFSIEDPEDGEKKYVSSFAYTRPGEEKYDYNPIMTPNGLRYACEFDIDQETGKPNEFTFEDMMSYMDSTTVNYMPEMSMEGIAKEAFDARNEIDKAIFAEVLTSVEKDIPITK